ncbi:type VII secretion protein EccE [Mycobacterium lehmannii]|uniref:type VII secretion protein EccE n=1 Tax=Mycobacterium lehmannii TaxID=2048550 RepID=UPI000B946191|nr:type VII secretion protein EccE [Mycobacterium lehmannii]
MKASTVGVRAGTPVVVALEVVALVAFLALPPARFGWWPAAVITAVALLLLVPTLHRRNAPAWVAAAARWRSQRSPRRAAAAAVDVPHGNIVCGVRVEPFEALTMIEVTGQPYALTFLRGSTVSLTRNVLPLELLAELLDQPGGLKLGIDVVPAGHRVRRGSGYPPLYSTLLADRPAAGVRTLQLIVRLDIQGSLPGLQYRRSIGAAAAAATERIITAMLERDIRATALTAEQLDAALDRLGARLQQAPSPPVIEGADAAAEPVPFRSTNPATRRRAQGGPEVGWRTVKGHPGFFTTYYFSPEDITTGSLHQMWALRTDEVVLTLSLFKRRYTEAPDGDGPVMVAAMVRTNDPQPPPQPPTLYLNPLPGDQYAAAVRAAPAARPQHLQIPARRLDNPAALEIPIGSTGILVGAALRDDRRATPEVQRDDLVMLSLTDPQRATRIVMDAGDYYVRQLLIRAAAVGERIAIYSRQPNRWIGLSQPNIAVVDRHRPAEFVPSIIVNDRPVMPPPAGLSSTVITLGRSQPGGQQPDIHFQQISRQTVRISTAAQSIEVAIVAFNQEQAWLGL